MGSLATHLRAFAPEDYDTWVAAINRCYAEYPVSVRELRHQDDTFDRSRFFMDRRVVEDDGRLVGGFDLRHRPSRFHPHRYALDLFVSPEARRRGHGSALYDAALELLELRHALAAVVMVTESMPEGVRFAEQRGFVEVKRDWESRLTVADFDFGKFAGADERVAASGIRISTYADELVRDPEAVGKTYELTSTLRADVPSTDQATHETIEEWRAHWVDAPSFLPDAFFIAIGPDGRWLGMSNLEKQIEDPTFAWQGLTAVHRDVRGAGIATALKLRTIRYAQAMGVDHIKTWNDQSNLPMLAINEAMGFVRQPAWLSMELTLPTQPA